MNASEAHRQLRHVPANSDPAGVRSFFERAISQAKPGQFLRIELMAPPVPAERLLSASDSPGFLWSPTHGIEFAGLKTCYRWVASGESDFIRLRAEIQEIVRRTRTILAPGLAQSKVRAFGGLAFSPTGIASSEWRDFGRGAFSLPRWLYTRDSESARLCFMDSGQSLHPSQPEDTLAEFDAINRALLSERPVKSGDLAQVSTQMPREAWDRLIESALSEIRGGRLNKVVLARRATVTSAQAFDEARVLSLLTVPKGGNPTRFAVRERCGTFLGATPEKLVVRRGREVSTEALAGSIAAAAPRASSALTASAKDQGEHGWVVQAMVRGLTPYCERLFVPDRAQVKRFGDVVHLWTPIEGHLAKETHVLELVGALHPTPAVGGEPTGAALKWISEREPDPRGWYAGPVGWFDENGDGEFYVAIRSALVARTRAYVYAGAGIVADSNSKAEFAETALKQRLLLCALGALQ